jgi:hypothetical protein
MLKRDGFLRKYNESWRGKLEAAREKDEGRLARRAMVIRNKVI